MRPLGRPLAICSLVLLASLAAPVAHADDADVRKAWRASDAGLKKAERDLRRAAGAFASRGFKRPGPMLRVARRARRLAQQTRRRVVAEDASTATGGRARKYALLSLRAYERSYGLFARSARQLSAGRSQGFGTAAKAGEWTERAKRRARKARRLFEQAKDEPALDPPTS